MDKPTDTTATLQGIIDALQAEWTQMQIMGRGLLPEEQQRSDRIKKAMPLLQEAHATLTGAPIPETSKT